MSGLHALQEFGALHLAAGQALEGDPLADRVEKLDRADLAAHGAAGIGAGLDAFGRRSGPDSAVETFDSRVTGHHVSRLAFELNHAIDIMA